MVARANWSWPRTRSGAFETWWPRCQNRSWGHFSERRPAGTGIFERGFSASREGLAVLRDRCLRRSPRHRRSPGPSGPWGPEDPAPDARAAQSPLHPLGVGDGAGDNQIVLHRHSSSLPIVWGSVRKVRVGARQRADRELSGCPGRPGWSCSFAPAGRASRGGSARSLLAAKENGRGRSKETAGTDRRPACPWDGGRANRSGGHR